NNDEVTEQLRASVDFLMDLCDTISNPDDANFTNWSHQAMDFIFLGIKCSKAFPLLVMYLQNERYSLWEVIEFGDFYKSLLEETGKGPSSESSARKKGRTVAITTKDMQKRRNDVKARTTLLLALPDEHQLRFSKYETAKELWEAILKTFGRNEATKKTKKNQLKLQYEWLIYIIVWRNRDDLYLMSLDDVYNHLKVYEPKVQKKSGSNSQNMAFISSSNTNSGKGEVHTASVPTASIQVSTTSTDVVAASLSHDTICAYIATQLNGSQIKYKDIT
nr:protein multipolar spindle 1 isoform X2 [Tanacetum cinerariifolium]